MQQLLKVFNSLSIIGPVLALLFLFKFSASTISMFLILIALFFAYKRAIASALIIIAFAVLLNQGITAPALLYPVLVSFVVFCAFFASLFSKKPLVQRFAEKMESNLPAHAIKYCYYVTIVWTVFLALNTVISYSTINNIQLWSWYNGVISYLLIALLFFCEYVFRQYYRKRFE